VPKKFDYQRKKKIEKINKKDSKKEKEIKS
jgi:hypothetical protein